MKKRVEFITKPIEYEENNGCDIIEDEEEVEE